MASDLVEMARAVADVVKASTGHDDWGANVGMGADGTPTKWIDAHAEQALIAQMDKRGIEADLLSEEAGVVERGGQGLLVADPVDGTHNAARGLPFYCVSLAYGRSHLSDVSEGVVVNVPTGEVYHAVKGKGATLNGRALHVREWHAGRDTISVYLGPDASRASFDLSHMPKRVRGFGAAALEISLVAAGALDAYVQWGNPLRITDIAAGALILREAGGELYDFSGARLEMPLTMMARRDVTAACSPELAAAISKHPRARNHAAAPKAAERGRAPA